MPTEGIDQLRAAAEDAADFLEMLGLQMPEEQVRERFLGLVGELRAGIEASKKKSSRDHRDQPDREVRSVAWVKTNQPLPDPRPIWERTRDKRRAEREEVATQLEDLWREVENKW